MKHLRTIIKLIIAILYTGVICLIYLILIGMGWIIKLPYEPIRNFFMMIWSKGILKLFNTHITVEGNPPVPPFFLVSNHLSYFDIIIYFSLLKTTFIAKMDVKSWPVLGFLISSMGVIFIDRTKRRDVQRVNKLISSNLNSRQGIILFPEGTTSPGESVLPFRASLLEYPSSNNIPVHYSSVRYETDKSNPPAFLSVSWWGDAGFMDHFYHLASLKKIHATVVFGEQPIYESDRKLLSSRLHLLVTRLFEPMVKPGKTKDYTPPTFLNN